MTIQNQRGINGYSQYMDTWLEGQPTGGLKADNKTNPKRAQITTVAVGGTATDGDYTITVTDPALPVGAPNASFAVTVTRAGTPATNADLAQALRDAFNASSDAAGIVSAGGTGADVVLSFQHNGRDYTVGVSAPAPGTLTPSATQAAGGVNLPFGRFVVADPSAIDGVALPAGAAETDLLGVTIRSIAEGVNRASESAASIDELVPGDMVATGFDGEIAVRNNGATTSGTGPTATVFVVVNTAGGQNLGEARSDADGGNTVAVDATRAYWLDEVAPGSIGRIRLRL